MLNDLDQDSSKHIERWFDMRVGVIVYGLASAAAGIMDFIWGDFDGAHQPIQAFGDRIPGREILAYITAVAMIAGGVAILWRRSARTGAAVLAVVYFIFAVFWLPRLYTAPHFRGFRIPVYIGVLAGVGMELIAFTAGALVYASLSSSSWPRTISYYPLDIWTLLNRLRLEPFD
jgi:uncharacterized membrane protein YphA (DoxX/SURF4 family)